MSLSNYWAQVPTANQYGSDFDDLSDWDESDGDDDEAGHELLEQSLPRRRITDRENPLESLREEEFRYFRRQWGSE